MLTDVVKVYSGAFDAKGNSVLKFGTSSDVGTITFVVPADVQSVVIYAACYKSNENNNRVVINGTTYDLTALSDNGEYEAITIDTSVEKTVVVATEKNGGGKPRIMIDSIVFILGELCEHVWNDGVVTEPTCATAGYTTFTCTLCETTKVENEVAATGEHVWNDGVVTEPNCGAAGYTTFTCTLCETTKVENEVAANGNHVWNDGVVTEPTCGAAGYTTFTCTLCETTKVENEVAATGNHSYTDGVCSVCGGNDPDYVDPNAPVVGTAYHFGMINTNKDNNVYYIKGGMVDYYFATSSDVAEALEVYLESTDGGYYLYVIDNGNKLYINFVVVTGSDNKLHTNSKYEETASTVFVYNSVFKTVETDIDGEIYILGTRNDKSYTTVGPVKASSNPFYCEFYAITEGGEDPVDPQPPVEEPGEDPVDPQPPVEEPGEDPVDPQPPVDEPTGEEIVFDLGENGTAHNDGTEIKDGTITFTSNGYELVLTDLSKVFSGAFDAKGNSVLKLGASSVTGSFEFTVPNDVVSVEIYIAKYKSNTTKIQINDGTAESLTKNSNDGEYDVITVDTTTNKTVKVSTVSGGVRAMVNTIVFITGEAPAPCEHEWNEGEVTAPTCGAVGYTTYTCTLCESTKVEDEVAATGEHVWDEGVVTAPTCGAAGYTTFTCTLCESTKKDNEVPATDDHSYDIVVVAPTCTKGGYTTYTCECGDTYVADELDALGHSYTDGVCTICGRTDGSVEKQTVTLAYTGDTTINMTGDNDAATLGLDATLFSVVGDKGATSQNCGLNKSGNIRLYGNSAGGNGSYITVTIAEGYVIESIKITFVNTSNNKNCQLTVGEDSTVFDGSAKVWEANINSDSFELKNVITGSTTQIHIASIEITYYAA